MERRVPPARGRIRVACVILFFERDPSIPRISARIAIPDFVSPIIAEWAAATSALPVGVRLCDATGMDPVRVAVLLAGTDAASRSEAMTIDYALGTNAARFLPPTSSRFVATATSAPIVPKPKGGLCRVEPKPLSAAHVARVESWRERRERSGLLMTVISAKTKIAYARVKELLSRGAIPTTAEKCALERLLGR